MFCCPGSRGCSDDVAVVPVTHCAGEEFEAVVSGEVVVVVVVIVVVVVVVSLVVAQPLPPLGTRLTAGSLLLCSLFKLGRLAGGRRAEGTFPRLCIPCLRGNVFFCCCCSKDSPLHSLYKLLMSNDWNLDFPFSPFDASPDRVDMLSAGNHLVLIRPKERTFCLGPSKWVSNSQKG